MADYVLFASLRQEQEWNSGKVPPQLARILLDAAEYALTTWGWVLCLKSIWRNELENAACGSTTRVHVVWHAVDVRTRDVSPVWVDHLAAWINERWIYDPERPAKPVAYSKPHGDGPHLHVQIHSNTVARPEPQPKQIGEVA